jgi:hypothetical protein
MRRLLVSALAAVSFCWSAVPSSAALSHDELEKLAVGLAAKLSRDCPQAPYGDSASFQACSLALSHSTDLPFANDVLWGGDQANFRIKKRKLTHFNPTVFRSMYLPLMIYTGRFSLGRDEQEKLDIVRLEAYFRNELPAGEYPYPFWHSADKWNDYETMNIVNFYLDEKGRIVVVTRSADGKDENRGAYANVRPPAFVKDQWTWTDASGRAQPVVSLFSWRYQSANPRLASLDKTYRTFAANMREASCISCHNPANTQGVNWLTLLQTPVHAAGEVGRVIKAVQDGVMPQDDIGLRKEIEPKLREAILRSAKAFQSDLNAADAWEASKPAQRPAAAASATPPAPSKEKPTP